MDDQRHTLRRAEDLEKTVGLADIHRQLGAIDASLQAGQRSFESITRSLEELTQASIRTAVKLDELERDFKAHVSEEAMTMARIRLVEDTIEESGLTKHDARENLRASLKVWGVISDSFDKVIRKIVQGLMLAALAAIGWAVWHFGGIGK